MFEFTNPFEAKAKTIAMEMTTISVDANEKGDIEKAIVTMVNMYNINNYAIDLDGTVYRIRFEAPKNLEARIYALLGIEPKVEKEGEKEESEE